MSLKSGNRIAWVLLFAGVATSAALLNPEAEAESGAAGAKAAETAKAPEKSAASEAAKPEAGSPEGAKGESAKSEHEGALGAGAVQVASAEEPKAAHAARSGACLVDPASIEDLRKRREDIDAKAKEIAAREAELKSRERALGEELAKLEAVRSEIDKGRGVIKKQEEEKLAKVVETLETMSPKSAAQLMATLDDGLAVTAMQRLATAKLAKIMNLLDPERAAQLTEALTGVKGARKDTAKTTAKETNREVAAANTKGGSATDGAQSAQSNQPAASARP